MVLYSTKIIDAIKQGHPSINDHYPKVFQHEHKEDPSLLRRGKELPEPEAFLASASRRRRPKEDGKDSKAVETGAHIRLGPACSWNDHIHAIQVHNVASFCKILVKPHECHAEHI